MNSSELQDTRFMRGNLGVAVPGYDVSDVDDLIGRIGAELASGGSAASLVETATLRVRAGRRAYDIDAVDWLLDGLIADSGRPETADPSVNPWCDLGPMTPCTVGRPSAGSRREVSRKDFRNECAKAWRSFGQPPGMQLRWEPGSRGAGELRTVEQEVIATVSAHRSGMSWSSVITVGEQAFASSAVDGQLSAGIAVIAERSCADYIGHYATGIPGRYSRWALGAGENARRSPEQLIRGLADETGLMVLYQSGINYAHRAVARIVFPDQTWLRFLVRGTTAANAIMTAVDQHRDPVIRYRLVTKGESRRRGARKTAEITVRPHLELTDELILAICVSANWLSPYFAFPDTRGGGGG